MEDKNILNEYKILDIEQLSKLSGGTGTETGELIPIEKSLLLNAIRTYKEQGFTLEQALADLTGNSFYKEKAAQFDAFIRQEWANV